MPLVKPMVGCTSDGYVLFVLGPFAAKHNDVTIIKECFKTNQHVMNTISEGDIILVDRNFRDVMEFLRKEEKVEHLLSWPRSIRHSRSKFITICYESTVDYRTSFW